MQKFDIVRQAKVLNIVIFSFMAAIGLFFLIFSPMPVLVEVIMLSVLCILVGGAKILGYLSNDLYRLAFQFDFAIGLFLIVIGILSLIWGRDDVLGLARLFGIYVLIDGLLKVQTSFDAKKFGIQKWFIVLITALFVVAAGVVTMIAPYAEQVSQVLILYISLLVDGLVNIWITAYTVRVRAKKKNFEERIVLDAEESDTEQN
jgi:uncharacterized membrane protein HdeD (DUF308 family)